MPFEPFVQNTYTILLFIHLLGRFLTLFAKCQDREGDYKARTKSLADPSGT